MSGRRMCFVIWNVDVGISIELHSGLQMKGKLLVHTFAQWDEPFRDGCDMDEQSKGATGWRVPNLRKPTRGNNIGAGRVLDEVDSGRLLGVIPTNTKAKAANSGRSSGMVSRVAGVRGKLEWQKGSWLRNT